MEFIITFLAKFSFTQVLKKIKDGALKLNECANDACIREVLQEERVGENYLWNKALWLFGYIIYFTFVLACLSVLCVILLAGKLILMPVFQANPEVVAGSLLVMIQFLLCPIMSMIDPFILVGVVDLLTLFDWLSNACWLAVVNFPLSIFYGIIFGMGLEYCKRRKYKLKPIIIDFINDMKSVLLNHKRSMAFCLYLIVLLWFFAYHLSKANELLLTGNGDKVGCHVFTGFLFAVCSVASMCLYSKLRRSGKACTNSA